MRKFIHVYQVVKEFVVCVEDRDRGHDIIKSDKLMAAALKAVKESKSNFGPVISVGIRDVPTSQLIAVEPEVME